MWAMKNLIKYSVVSSELNIVWPRPDAPVQMIWTCQKKFSSVEIWGFKYENQQFLLFYLPVVYLSFLNHQTWCNVYLANSHYPQQVLTRPETDAVIIKNDAFRLWRSLNFTFRNELKLQLYFWCRISVIWGSDKRGGTVLF